MALKRIGLISTIGINFGDEFIRDGIIYSLKQAFPRDKTDLIIVHKHDFLRFYKLGFLFDWLPRGKKYFVKLVGRETVFDSCDAIVQCGAPIFWEDCSSWGTWQNILWHKILKKFSGKIPILNLGGGSSYYYHSKNKLDVRLSDPDGAFIRHMLKTADVTTVRDELAQSIALSCGYSVKKIPCPAYLASLAYALQSKSDEYIIINYMPLGGHYNYGYHEPIEKWKDTLLDVIKKIQGAGEKLILFCHNQHEMIEAKKLNLKIPIVLPRNRLEYMQIVAKAKGGICNRIHCSVVLASLGKPSLAVGNDTRLLMANEFQIPTFFVSQVSSDHLYEKFKQVVSDKELCINNKSYFHTFIAKSYTDIFHDSLSSVIKQL